MRLTPILALLPAGSVAVDKLNVRSPEEGPYAEPVTAALLARFTRFASYAAAAYCLPNNNSPNSQLSCLINNSSSTSCPLLHKNPTIKTLWEFENIEPGDTTGFLAVDTVRRELVLSLRGSQSKSNWRTNKLLTLRDWSDACPSCKVHRGFLEAYRAAQPRLILELTKARAQYPAHQLIVTGHSLGGALATVIATSLRSEAQLAPLLSDSPLHLYTFGAPKVGNPALASAISAVPHRNYRITKGADPVPHVPLDAGTLWHYRQFYPEYHVEPNTLSGSVAPDDVVVCTESDRKACEVRWNVQKWEPHAWYFGGEKVSACKPLRDASDEKKGESADVNVGGDPTDIGGELEGFLGGS